MLPELAAKAPERYHSSHFTFEVTCSDILLLAFSIFYFVGFLFTVSYWSSDKVQEAFNFGSTVFYSEM